MTSRVGQEWNSRVLERIYTACLDVVLLMLPLVVMTTTYGLISYKLWPRGGASGDAAAQTTRRTLAGANGQYKDTASIFGSVLPNFFWQCENDKGKLYKYVCITTNTLNLIPTQPITNLSVLSKLLERLVAQQLTEYLTENGLLPELQSAYRVHHSTETAMLKVMGDILLALDSGNLAMLSLLDLSAAFDTVDHDTLLRRLQTSYGFDDIVIKWFISYLSGRVQYVNTDHQVVPIT